jgi:DNA polymerase-3 subunit alpha
VNSSDFNFTPAGESILFGLGAVRNLGQNAVAAIRAARAEVGPLRSLFHFCEHVDLKCLNKRTIESMIKAGAMDSLGGTRAQLYDAVDRAIESGQKIWRDRESGQGGLFGAPPPEEQQSAEALPEVAPWSEQETLAGEKEMLGFYVTGHPLDAHQDKIRELATHDSSALEGLAWGTEVALCGMLTAVAVKRNREGKLWASAQLEDRAGSIDLLVFQASFDSLRDMLEPDRAVLVRGNVRPEENAPPKVAVSDITPLDLARVRVPERIYVKVRLGSANGELIERLGQLFRDKPGDTDVCFRLEQRSDFLVLLDAGLRVRADREFCAAVEKLLGSGSVEAAPA